MKNLFKKRTKQLALRFIKIDDALPKNRTADVIGITYNKDDFRGVEQFGISVMTAQEFLRAIGELP